MEIGIIPHFILRKLSADSARRLHLNVFLSSSLVVLFFSLWSCTGAYLSALPHFCLVRACTGLPCPGCGVCRSLAAFFHGDFVSAWALQPGGPVLALFLLAQIPARALFLLYNRTGEGAGLRLMGRWVPAALFAGWLLKFINQT